MCVLKFYIVIFEEYKFENLLGIAKYSPTLVNSECR